jgi:acetyl-CoA synthetase
LEHIIIVGEGGPDLEEEYVLWDTGMAQASDELDIEWVDKEFPLFMIYTSGQQGKAIGLLHPHDAMRGYLMTSRWVLDLKDGDRLWTQGQPGWFLSVVYSAFAPWLCGIESFVAGRIRSAEEMYRLIEEHRISVLYTIPALYRFIIRAGDDMPKKYDLKSLRHLLSVFDPLFPDVIYAVLRIVGLPIYDTWWSAETGMITVANLLCMPLKPGYLGKPVPGIHVAVLNSEGNEAPPFTMGEIAVEVGWPCMARGVWGNEEVYQRYISNKPWFMSGDTAFVDFDHYLFYQGRADDVIITSAGKTGLAEIENILHTHPAIAEVGVIRIPGKEGIKKTKAFICLKPEYKPTDLLKKKLMDFVKKNFAYDIAPREIEFCESLPRDKNGNLLRRVLKAWELNLPVGNISSLSNE